MRLLPTQDERWGLHDRERGVDSGHQPESAASSYPVVPLI
jgi:hypothetical protein